MSTDTTLLAFSCLGGRGDDQISIDRSGGNVPRRASRSTAAPGRHAQRRRRRARGRQRRRRRRQRAYAASAATSPTASCGIRRRSATVRAVTIDLVTLERVEFQALQAARNIDHRRAPHGSLARRSRSIAADACDQRHRASRHGPGCGDEHGARDRGHSDPCAPAAVVKPARRARVARRAARQRPRRAKRDGQPQRPFRSPRRTRGQAGVDRSTRCARTARPCPSLLVEVGPRRSRADELGRDAGGAAQVSPARATLADHPSLVPLPSSPAARP